MKERNKEKTNFLKVSLIVLSFLALFFLQTRSAMLAATTAVIIFYFIPLFNQLSKKLKLSLIALAIFLAYNIIFFLIDHTFIGRHLATISNRIDMWELGIETIRSSPWIGIGFDVTPNFYGLKEPFGVNQYISSNQINTIHNMFIRIATENGLPLLLLIVLTLIFSIIRLFQSKDYFAIAVLFSVIFFHCFSTRHISINLMNIIFYIFIMKSFYDLRIKN